MHKGFNLNSNKLEWKVLLDSALVVGGRLVAKYTNNTEMRSDLESIYQIVKNIEYGKRNSAEE